MLLFPQLAGQSHCVNISWIEVRCAGCGRLLQKMEPYALKPGKHIEIKCAHCKVLNDLVGTDVNRI
jgi:phage FluMu protein Com